MRSVLQKFLRINFNFHVSYSAVNDRAEPQPLIHYSDLCVSYFEYAMTVVYMIYTKALNSEDNPRRTSLSVFKPLVLSKNRTDDALTVETTTVNDIELPTFAPCMRTPLLPYLRQRNSTGQRNNLY